MRFFPAPVWFPEEQADGFPAQLRGAFCLLRKTKKVAVATTTSSGTAVNSSRAIADQSVYTAEQGREVASSSQQAEVPLRDCTTRHSRQSCSVAG